jgi:hypothetical protein
MAVWRSECGDSRSADSMPAARASRRKRRHTHNSYSGRPRVVRNNDPSAGLPRTASMASTWLPTMGGIGMRRSVPPLTLIVTVPWPRS